MRKLLIALVAAVALAVPTTALAWDGHHHHHHFGVLAAFFAKGDADHATFAVRAGGDNDENSQGKDNDNDGGFLLAQLSGTGTSFGANAATASGDIVGGNDHANGHFSITLSTDWSAAQSKTFTEEDGDSVTISCAPSTASSTLSNGSTTTTSLAGKTCTKTENGVTKSGFFGRSDNGVHLFLKEDSSGNVRGVELSRS